MSTTNTQAQSFLLELYRRTAGQEEGQVMMAEVGEALGLDKSEARSLAEELIIDELVELKTLSGGIGITDAGRELLLHDGLIDRPAAPSSPALSGKPICDESDRRIIDGLILELQAQFPFNRPSYQGLEELIIDIKTLQVYLLSPRPKNAVILAVLESLRQGLLTLDMQEMAAKLAALAAEN